MSSFTTFLVSRTGLTLVGLFIGVAAAVLQKLGNPPNMGICVACMERDIAGALGLHRAAVVQYIRPEIIGLILGSLGGALAFKEFRARTGSAPIIRFVLGFFAMLGALVFLGCPWRAFLRLAGGDANALVGLAGFGLGIWVGILFLRSGYTLGRKHNASPGVGLVLPLFAVSLLLLLWLRPSLPSGAPFFSTKGPGAMRAPAMVSLLVALVIGFLLQRSRFCTVGAVRNLVLTRDLSLFLGVVAMTVGAAAANLVFGQFKLGFAGQPVAHESHLWNLGGMVLSGLAFVLGGGCPGRQLVLSGEGDGDAALFVLGMFAGAAFAHNFSTASSPAGPGAWGPASVVTGLAVCVVIGFSMRERVSPEGASSCSSG